MAIQLTDEEIEKVSFLRRKIIVARDLFLAADEPEAAATCQRALEMLDAGTLQ